MLVCDVLWYLFLIALWSPAGKGLTTWLSCLLYFVTFPNMSWTTSELRARSAPWSWFKPSSKTFYWPFQGGTSFVDLLWVLFGLVFAMPLWASVYVCLEVSVGKGLTSWLSFVVSNCEFVTFPLVSWVRCGTWSYRFLIVAPLLTLKYIPPKTIIIRRFSLSNKFLVCKRNVSEMFLLRIQNICYYRH